MLIMEKIKAHPNARMRDPQAVQRKLDAITRDGFEKLMIISDFDFTFSRYKDENGRCWSTHAVFDHGTRTTRPEFSKKLIAVCEKYYKIEFCPKMSKEEKIPYMEEWWKTSHDMIIAERFTYPEVEELVVGARILFRDYAAEFVHSADAHGVPFILFSAGLANIIEIVLRKNLGNIPRTLHVISNVMKFDKDGYVSAFTDPVIHTFNKNSSVIQGDESFHRDTHHRTNVILLGDSLGDIHMDLGLENEGTAIKIGFLNADFEQLREKYTESYDIVLEDCQSMQLPLDIFRFVGSVHASSQPCLEKLCHVEEQTQSDEDDVSTANVSA